MRPRHCPNIYSHRCLESTLQLYETSRYIFHDDTYPDVCPFMHCGHLYIFHLKCLQKISNTEQHNQVTFSCITYCYLRRIINKTNSCHRRIFNIETIPTDSLYVPMQKDVNHTINMVAEQHLRLMDVVGNLNYCYSLQVKKKMPLKIVNCFIISNFPSDNDQFRWFIRLQHNCVLQHLSHIITQSHPK